MSDDLFKGRFAPDWLVKAQLSKGQYSLFSQEHQGAASNQQDMFAAPKAAAPKVQPLKTRGGTWADPAHKSPTTGPKTAPKAKTKFIGPRGGEWADAKHTIPYREGKSKAKPAAKKDPSPARHRQLRESALRDKHNAAIQEHATKAGETSGNARALHEAAEKAHRNARFEIHGEGKYETHAAKAEKASEAAQKKK